MDIVYLTPIYDRAKSFYEKAKVRTYYDYDDNNQQVLIKELISYDTLVARVEIRYINSRTIYTSYGNYSRTTSRHQREFFRQEGLTDKEIYMIKTCGTIIKEGVKMIWD